MTDLKAFSETISDEEETQESTESDNTTMFALPILTRLSILYEIPGSKKTMAEIFMGD